MLDIVNATPHLIRVITHDGETEIKPSGVHIRLSEKRRFLREVMGFALIKKEYDGLDGEEFLLNIRRPTMVIVSTIVGIWIQERGLKWSNVLIVAPDTGSTAKRRGGFLVGVNSFVVYSDGLEEK